MYYLWHCLPTEKYSGIIYFNSVSTGIEMWLNKHKWCERDIFSKYICWLLKWNYGSNPLPFQEVMMSFLMKEAHNMISLRLEFSGILHCFIQQLRKRREASMYQKLIHRTDLCWAGTGNPWHFNSHQPQPAWLMVRDVAVWCGDLYLDSSPYRLLPKHKITFVWEAE